MSSDLNVECCFVVLYHHKNKTTLYIYVAFAIFNIFPLGNNHLSYGWKDFLIALGILHKLFMESEPVLYRTIIKLILRCNRRGVLYYLVYIFDQHINMLCIFSVLFPRSEINITYIYLLSTVFNIYLLGNN